MTGLLPQKRIQVDAAAVVGRVSEVFSNVANLPTIERVIKYLRPFYEQSSNRSFDEISRPNVKTEEFFILMPTKEAWLDELKLVEAIEGHAAGKVTDLEIKAILDAFIASHTFIYFEDSRSCKVGNWDAWADCELVYIREPESNFGFTLNLIQEQLIKLLHSDKTFGVTRL